jgi:site-specific DNA-methyltransferase (adenine-specific)
MESAPRNKILFGVCEEVLRTLPAASVDAVVTDPPYGLGTREPTAKDIELYLKGVALDTGGDFMGKEWEIPSVPTWLEVYRVLKPGGYVLSFAGTRTWDIMSLGLRAAGFDNRDTISSLFSSPCLQWLHGQGFPKSTNIAKKLKERAKECAGNPAKVEHLLKLARVFEGFGTALKPAWEPILCFRRSLEAETLADQVAASGTGGINIDGTRIKHASAEDFAKHKEHVDRIKAEGGQWGDSWKNSSDLSGASEVTSAGRWPPNAVMTHSPDCKLVGTRKVDAPTINRFTDGMKPFGNGAGHEYETSGGGEEDIPVYECTEGCAVKALDAQSGTLTSGLLAPSHDGGGLQRTAPGGFRQGTTGVRKNYGGDSGGASKFFAQFMPDAPFYYTGKASKREKNSGVVKGQKLSSKKGQRVVVLRDNLKSEDMERLIAEWPMEADDERSGWDPDPKHPRMEAFIPEELRDLFAPAKPDDNDHPTVKPVRLMAWLVKMVTPKGGIVLDPYCGSGSTCVAALDVDCDYVAIEKDALYFKLAERRLRDITDNTLGLRGQVSAFEAAMASIPNE